MKVTVLGGGSWGTALANHLAKHGISTSIWHRKPEIIEAINNGHKNPKYCSSFILEKNLLGISDLKKAASSAEVIVLAIPSQHFREMVQKIIPYLSDHQILVSVAKGIEAGSLKLLSEIAEELLPPSMAERFTTLGGPSFAKEVLEEQPTAVTVAGFDSSCVEDVQHLFHHRYFRVYRSTDLIGVEMGGALKNVIAIATGIAEGLGFRANTRAALITRGLAEILRVGVKKGARPETFLGLSGVGDLVLTCTGDLSRNRRVGIHLGKGENLDEILTKIGEVSEGVTTTISAYHLAKRLGVDAPITQETYRILYEGKSPRDSLRDLLDREMALETVAP
ncbi:MAG TPA: NAD(P)H-dependent glycerol-3-phosphate dehydrogenase [Bdellovibrionota bacterium]|nr:NAD(P)H-dependent glycerol-3-phosphate dehydrogenase [Bdellovibrionota bacterium]